MTGAEHTIAQLVARFVLRRQASSAEFVAGVWLVSQGAVRLKHLSARALHAVVRDGTTETVTIVARGTDLVGDCSCGAGRGRVCRHQVAATHALWLQGQALE